MGSITNMEKLRHPLLMRSIFLCLICITILSTSFIYAQNLSGLGHQAWSTENGLPQNSVHQIFQTRDGYIWISTEGGIARFNGIDFKVFSQENTSAFTTDDTCCLAQTPDGDLWIGTADGLIRYHAGAIRRYTIPNGSYSSDIKSLAATNDGILYILTSDAILTFDGTKFASLPLPSNSVPLAMTSDSNGALWIASSSQILTYDHGAFHQIPLPPGLSKEAIEGIGALPNHIFWLRTRSSITLSKNGTVQTLQAGHDLPAARLQSFLQDSRGNLWIGTSNGLFEIDRGTHSPHLEPPLQTNSILSIFEDIEGNLWIGTETAGLHILRQQDFHTLPALPDHVITAITQSTDGAMWIGTSEDGLDRWQDGKVQHFSAQNGILSDIILALAAGRDDSVWVGTPDGLNHISGSRIEAYSSADGLADDFIRSLLLDEDGSLWIGTRHGLTHWQGKNFTTYTQADGLKSNLIGALIQTRRAEASPDSTLRDLWIGTLDGLSRLRDGKIATYTTNDGLSGNVITALLRDSGDTLWIGTKGNGLSRSTSNGFLAIHQPDLPRSIDSILEGSRGNLWLSSTHGITRVPRTDLLACGTSPNCTLHVQTYGRSDGMPTEEASSIGHPTAWKDARGLLWFATRKGVAIVDPDNLPADRRPVSVVIDRFTVDDSEINPSASELDIAPGHNRFAFEYAGLSYSSPSRIRYRYILEGFDKQWTEAGSRRSAYYTNLPPRHYRFRVQAANSDGTWNQAGATLSFYVRPAFYRRAWFLLLVLSLLAAIVVLLYRLRVRRLRSQFDAVLAERNRMAREIHDTLAQSFVGVSVQLELTAQLLTQSQIAAAHQQIDRTRTYVREGLAEARRSIWDLRAITAQDTLPTRLTRLVERTDTTQLHIDLTIGGTYRPLTPSIESEVLRIAQEALTNVARHAKATHVTADLRYHANRLVLVISDNGRGFETADDSLPAKGHFGLQGMRERAEQINAQLNVKSSPGQGVSITLDVPIGSEKGMLNNG
jgi:signal transduction histidine kinase/ligand-binding sensor domain-containing protein